MALKPFTRRMAKDDDLNRIQSDLETAINPALKKEILDGVLVSGEVSTTTSSIAHGLGRVPKGWFVVSGHNDIGVAQAADANYLYVSSSGGTNTVTFWVF